MCKKIFIKIYLISAILFFYSFKAMSNDITLDEANAGVNIVIADAKINKLLAAGYKLHSTQATKDGEYYFLLKDTRLITCFVSGITGELRSMCYRP